MVADRYWVLYYLLFDYLAILAELAETVLAIVLVVAPGSLPARKHRAIVDVGSIAGPTIVKIGTASYIVVPLFIKDIYIVNPYLVEVYSIWILYLSYRRYGSPVRLI